METAYGLGADGPLWSHSELEPAIAFRADRALRDRVRARLLAAEREATMLLTRHVATLDRLAQRLLVEGIVEGRELGQLLRSISAEAPPTELGGALPRDGTPGCLDVDIPTPGMAEEDDQPCPIA